jgi:SAM-dependent methyltransferase
MVTQVAHVAEALLRFHVPVSETTVGYGHYSSRGRFARRALGCGTGTNSLYLAQHGFQVVGIDFSSKAVARARIKARHGGFPVEFVNADVTRLDFLKEPFDLILDIGCFHGIPPTARGRYAGHIDRLTRANSKYLLYAFSVSGGGLGFLGAGVTQEEVTQLFSPFMRLRRVQVGSDRGERTSAWYWFERDH